MNVKSIAMAGAFAGMALGAAIALTACEKSGSRQSATPQASKEKKMEITQDWDKVFAQSDKVNHKKVTFKNGFGITLVADYYEPKDKQLAKGGKLPAIAMAGPYGAVKEQVSGFYAQTLAEKGYVTIAFDPSYTGESGGEPRRVSSPDINTEDFMAAVDFLTADSAVDVNRIGILGVCGWGGIALNAAIADTRIKATVASTMYDMTRVSGNGYFDADDNEEARYKARVAVSEQRTVDYKNGSYKRGGGVMDPVPEDAPQFVKDYNSFYKTSRGSHPRAGASTDGWNVTGQISYANARFLHYIDEIRSPVLLVHGEKAHSRYFSEDAFKKMTANGKGKYAANKELYIVPGARHTDLYDKKEFIPWQKIEEFFDKNL